MEIYPLQLLLLQQAFAAKNQYEDFVPPEYKNCY